MAAGWRDKRDKVEERRDILISNSHDQEATLATTRLAPIYFDFEALFLVIVSNKLSLFARNLQFWVFSINFFLEKVPIDVI